jgi:hypothetical protein
LNFELCGARILQAQLYPFEQTTKTQDQRPKTFFLRKNPLPSVSSLAAGFGIISSVLSKIRVKTPEHNHEPATRTSDADANGRRGCDGFGG